MVQSSVQSNPAFSSSNALFGILPFASHLADFSKALKITAKFSKSTGLAKPRNDFTEKRFPTLTLWDFNIERNSSAVRSYLFLLKSPEVPPVNLGVSDSYS